MTEQVTLDPTELLRRINAVINKVDRAYKRLELCEEVYTSDNQAVAAARAELGVAVLELRVQQLKIAALTTEAA